MVQLHCKFLPHENYGDWKLGGSLQGKSALSMEKGCKNCGVFQNEAFERTSTYGKSKWVPEPSQNLKLINFYVCNLILAEN